MPHNHGPTEDHNCLAYMTKEKPDILFDGGGEIMYFIYYRILYQLHSLTRYKLCIRKGILSAVKMDKPLCA